MNYNLRNAETVAHKVFFFSFTAWTWSSVNDVQWKFIEISWNFGRWFRFPLTTDDLLWRLASPCSESNRIELNWIDESWSSRLILNLLNVIIRFPLTFVHVLQYADALISGAVMSLSVSTWNLSGLVGNTLNYLELPRIYPDHLLDGWCIYFSMYVTCCLFYVMLVVYSFLLINVLNYWYHHLSIWIAMLCACEGGVVSGIVACVCVVVLPWNESDFKRDGHVTNSFVLLLF